MPAIHLRQGGGLQDVAFGSEFRFTPASGS